MICICNIRQIEGDDRHIFDIVVRILIDRNDIEVAGLFGIGRRDFAVNGIAGAIDSLPRKQSDRIIGRFRGGFQRLVQCGLGIFRQRSDF